MAGTPQDLLKDTYVVDPKDKDYTLVTITDLNPGETYNMQFAWVYADKRATTEDMWSITKTITASTEAAPNKPKFINSNLWTADGILFYSWDGVDSSGAQYNGIDRVEVFITDANNTYGDGTRPIDSFRTAGTHSIVPPAGEYTMFLKAVTALGNSSDPSDSQSETVVSTGTTVQDPTLPVGLSAESVPFGLKVNWNGTYANGTSFSGYKSINVYAMNSDLGASTTTALDSSRIVAVFSVNDTSNSANIGLSSYVGYSQNTWLYYISVNDNDKFYEVNGIPTYTRINSSPLSPNKANFIDIANGVISIENLVAGNGQFQSWLRAGAWDGARVEISGLTNSFTDPSHSSKTVYPGISVWDSSGSNRVFYTSATGGLSISGGIKSSTGSSYITLGEVDGDANSASGKLTFKVSGKSYPGYITFDSLFGSESGSLTIAPPADTNGTGDVPFIDIYASGTSGLIGIYSPGTISIDGSDIVLGGSNTVVGIQSAGWYPPDSSSTYTTLKLLGATQGGTVTNTNIGLWFSGAYGTNAPGTTIGQNGDLLFST